MAELTWIEGRMTYEKYLFAQLFPHMVLKYSDEDEATNAAERLASKGADVYFGANKRSDEPTIDRHYRSIS